MVRFSVIIPVYNRPEEMDELLESLCRQTWSDFEVIVVEDGSQRDCQEVVEKYQSRLQIYYFRIANSGPGLARNYGIKKANEKYFVFLIQIASSLLIIFDVWPRSYQPKK